MVKNTKPDRAFLLLIKHQASFWLIQFAHIWVTIDLAPVNLAFV